MRTADKHSINDAAFPFPFPYRDTKREKIARLLTHDPSDKHEHGPTLDREQLTRHCPFFTPTNYGEHTTPRSLPTEQPLGIWQDCRQPF
jgi:hypothetical protein